MIQALPTKEQAFDLFFNQFGLFYEENSVPGGQDKPDFPYGTYEVQTGSFGDEFPISAKWWDRSSSWTPLNAKVHEIEATVAAGRGAIRCVGGGLRFRFGGAHNGVREDDPALKSKVLDFTVEFITDK